MIRRVSAAEVRRWMPVRRKEAHKGDCGRVLIVAGSAGMAGAGVLSTMGAVWGGAGLVRLITDDDQRVIAAKRVPLEVTLGRLSRLQAEIEKFDAHVIAAGPGLGTGARARQAINSVVTRSSGPVVLDADGLNVWRRRSTGPLVMTPHPGELARLMNTTTADIQKDRRGWVKRAAKKFSGVCLLKGSGTLISDGDVVYRNVTGVPEMASGGTGDVLTGLLAALWGQMRRDDPTGLKAAVVAAFIHGKAGERAAAKHGGLSITATQLAQEIQGAFKSFKRI